MKNYICILILTLGLGSVNSCLYSQTPNRNLISKSEFQSITFKGQTINDINATDGNPTDVRQLFGSYDSLKNREGMDRITFYYDQNSFTYYFLNERVTGITIKDNSWPVRIKGNDIRIGNTLPELKQKFGSNLKTINSDYISDIVVSFNYEGNSEDGIHIYLDSNTNKVVKIKYWVNP